MNNILLKDRIASKIKSEILSGTLSPNEKLSVSTFSLRNNVSRTPVREAFSQLVNEGLLFQIKNKGFFVSKNTEHTISETPTLNLDEPEEYFLLAEDWVNNKIPQDITETFIRNKYGLTKIRTLELLNSAVRDGWLEPKPGYGWRLLEVAKSKKDLEDIYKIRAILEPMAILDPNFTPNKEKLAYLKNKQIKILEKGVKNIAVDALVKSGRDFHEGLSELSGSLVFSRILKYINTMRKLIEHKSQADTERLENQVKEHIEIIELIENDCLIDAAYKLKTHLSGSFNKKIDYIDE